MHSTLTDPTIGPKDDNYIRSACFSTDGKLIATGSEDRKIRIWDIANKRVRHTLEGHMNEIYSLAFSPDGKFLYSGSGDQTARVWDIESGTPKFTLTIEDTVLSASGAPVDAGVTSIALSPSGRLLAAGSLDTLVRLWDTQTGKLVDKLRGHKDSVYSVAFAPDGSWLVSGSLDKTLKIWDLASVNAYMAGLSPAAVSEIKSEAGEGANGEGASTDALLAPPTPTVAEPKTQCVSTLSGHKVRFCATFDTLSLSFSRTGLCPIGGRLARRSMDRFGLQRPRRLVLGSESDLGHGRAARSQELRWVLVV
jgi:glucose repression regulatory protein TUP1